MELPSTFTNGLCVSGIFGGHFEAAQFGSRGYSSGLWSLYECIECKGSQFFWAGFSQDKCCMGGYRGRPRGPRPPFSEVEDFCFSQISDYLLPLSVDSWRSYSVYRKSGCETLWDMTPFFKILYPPLSGVLIFKNFIVCTSCMPSSP